MTWTAALPSLAGIAALLMGCVSTQTARRLDQSYRNASVRIERPVADGGADDGDNVDLSGPIDRDTIIELVVSRAPSLSAVSHRARALVHAAHAEGSLPAGEVSFKIWNLPLARPYSLGEANMYMVDLQQRFPAYGSLDAHARATLEEAEALLLDTASEERVWAQRAADAYASYVHGIQDHALHREHLQLLDQMQSAVRARLTTGGSAIADAARIELEVAKTQRSIARTTGNVARARAALNALLRRAADAPLGPPRQTHAEAVRLSVEELITQAHAHRGETLAVDARVRAASARRQAAEAEASYPEITVGVGYWQDPMRRPGFGTNVAMSLPWLWGGADHRVNQALEQEAAEISSGDDADVELQSEVTEAHARIAANEAELLTIDQQALPAARRSIEALIAAYTSGNATLLEWVDASRSVLDLKMESADVTEALALSVAALERAVGTSLPRVAVLTEAR